MLERSDRVYTLLDTESFAGNFIHRCTIIKHNFTQFVSISPEKLRKVCSGLDNHCYDISDTIDLTLSYFCHNLNNYYTFPITAFVLNDMKFDLIVERKTIRELNLFSRFPDQISANASSSTIPLPELLSSEYVDLTCGCQPKEKLQPSDGSPKVDPLTQKVKLAVTQKQVIQESERLFGAVPPDEDEIDDSIKDSFSPWIDEFPDTDPLSLIHIAGDEDQKNKIRLLVQEFQDIFSSELSHTPADIPPFDFHVNDSQWKVSKNRQPPWSKSTVDQADILSQITKFEKQGIVEKPNAAYYSQVLLVPKSDGTKRMCIDFQNLNSCTEDKSYSIPHIGEMLRRIGAHKAKVFAVLDLTQGCHQAPLTLAARAYTAFILFCGVYQFTRLPFGPKQAPSYFQ